jgi:hypothetical protein
MFVTFQETPHFPRGHSELNGSTVSILTKPNSHGFYQVATYDAEGKQIIWGALLQELIGFDGEVK